MIEIQIAMIRFLMIPSLFIFALSFMTSCNGIDKDRLSGRYILTSEEGCNFLLYKSDTMVLRNGKVFSNNFPEGSTYSLKRKDLNDLLVIHSTKEKTRSTLTIRKDLYGKLKIYVCTDNGTRYEKI